MKSLRGTVLIAAAWLIAGLVGATSGRWWAGMAVSVVLTAGAFRASDWMDRRAAVREEVASRAPDYRLVRH